MYLLYFCVLSTFVTGSEQLNSGKKKNIVKQLDAVFREKLDHVWGTVQKFNLKASDWPVFGFRRAFKQN